MRLRQIDGTFAVAQLSADADVPPWAHGPAPTAVIRTEDELTIVCDATRVPHGVNAQKEWACFRSIGPFAFDEAGILASLVTPISDRGIGVFVLCTFDGEHIFCPTTMFETVKKTLEEQGHVFDT